MAKIIVLETEISVIRINDDDYISLTDMVRNLENGEFFILNWLRNRNTIEFLGIWERVYNPDFNPVEFDRIKSQSGLNSLIRFSKISENQCLPNILFQFIWGRN